MFCFFKSIQGVLKCQDVYKDKRSFLIVYPSLPPFYCTFFMSGKSIFFYINRYLKTCRHNGDFNLTIYKRGKERFVTSLTNNV